jgi:transcriptional regulator with XRE-family HTH domain
MKGKNITVQRIAKARKAKKLSQLELSKMSCVFGAKLDRSAVAKIEVGLRQVRDYELVALAKALGVKPSFLLNSKYSRRLKTGE